MKKKVVSIFLVVVLMAIAAVGTLAYFTDTDNATNTMKVGDLDITVSEIGADGEEFDEDAILMMPGEANKIRKEIWTTLEAGSVDAYVRSIVLFEVTDEGWDFFWDDCAFTKHLPTESAWPVEYCEETVEIDGVPYVAACFYPNANGGKLTAGQEYCSMNQFWFKDHVTSAQIEELGANYNILTLSQAVQVTGNTAANNREALNNEFGVVNAVNVADWFSWVSGTVD